MKRPRTTHLEERKLMIPNDGKFMKFFLNHVKDGAEAMDVCVQDPPKSYADLEGAWYVWKLGGSASPRKGEGCED